MALRYHIGTSGWIYKHWKDVFYPKDLPQSMWFSHYASEFPTVEINATFYRLPSVSACEKWREQAPEGFVYAVKGSRFITQMKRLKDCEKALAVFLERVEHIRERLGPLLFQLPPDFQRDDEVLKDFLKILPANLSHAMEFRHASWYHPEVLDILRERNIAFCLHDFGKQEPPVVRTANFVYIRFHGTSGKYSGEYSHNQLESWAECIQRLGEGAEDVYVYFNNDVGGHALKNARDLTQLLS